MHSDGLGYWLSLFAGAIAVKIRPRLALSTLALIVPVLFSLSSIRASVMRYRMRAAVSADAMAYVQSTTEASCLTDARTHRSWETPPSRRLGGGAPWSRSAEVPRFSIHAYDSSFGSLSGDAPALSPALRTALQHQHVTVEANEPTPTGAITVAIATPWPRGLCAYVLLTHVGPGGSRFAMSWLPWQVVTVPAVLAMLILLLGLGPVLARVRRLGSAVRESANLGFVNSVRVEGDDEVADLAMAFNKAGTAVRSQIELLKKREEGLRTFLDNTMHDAMTPLTVLLAHLDQLTHKPTSATTLQSALDEAQYLASLLRNLSAIARLDGMVPPDAHAPVDLNAVVMRVLARFRAVGAQRRVVVDAAVPSEITVVHGDVTLIEQAISNLVHNAVRYQHDGGHVAITLDVDRAQHFILKVLDDGPGITAARRANILQNSGLHDRSPSSHPESRGLGLRIVHRVVAEHSGWTFELQAGLDNQGVCAIIEGQTADTRSAQTVLTNAAS